MKETVSFESLPRMVATSDLVIEGTDGSSNLAESWVQERLRSSSLR
jgi:hypothetical protein